MTVCLLVNSKRLRTEIPGLDETQAQNEIEKQASGPQVLLQAAVKKSLKQIVLLEQKVRLQCDKTSNTLFIYISWMISRDVNEIVNGILKKEMWIQLEILSKE